MSSNESLYESIYEKGYYDPKSNIQIMNFEKWKIYAENENKLIDNQISELQKKIKSLKENSSNNQYTSWSEYNIKRLDTHYRIKINKDGFVEYIDKEFEKIKNFGQPEVEYSNL